MGNMFPKSLLLAVMCAILSLLTLIFISTHLALGFVIITPSSANGWRNSGPQLLEWQLAGSDPSTFAVVLTSVDGTVNQLLAANVDSIRWSTDVNPPSGGWPVGTSFNFRVHFVKGVNHLNTIYASSQVFNIEAVVPVDTSTPSTPVPHTSTPIPSTILSSSAALTSPFSRATLTSSSAASATSYSRGARSTSSSLATKSSSTTSSTRSTTPPADKTTILTPSPYSTNPQYSTSHINTADASSATAPHKRLWRTFR